MDGRDQTVKGAPSDGDTLQLWVVAEIPNMPELERLGPDRAASPKLN